MLAEINENNVTHIYDEDDSYLFSYHNKTLGEYNRVTFILKNV